VREQNYSRDGRGGVTKKNTRPERKDTKTEVSASKKKKKRSWRGKLENGSPYVVFEQKRKSESARNGGIWERDWCEEGGEEGAEAKKRRLMFNVRNATSMPIQMGTSNNNKPKTGGEKRCDTP